MCSEWSCVERKQSLHGATCMHILYEHRERRGRMSKKNKLFIPERMGDREKETADFSSHTAVLFYFLECLKDSIK